jgi:ATP-dependent Clp protease ATP-binding subunit ClpB
MSGEGIRNKRFYGNRSKNHQVSDTAIEWLAIAGYDPQFVARPVKRVIQKNILYELSKRILSGSVQAEKPIKIDNVKERLVFENPPTIIPSLIK